MTILSCRTKRETKRIKVSKTHKREHYVTLECCSFNKNRRIQAIYVYRILIVMITSNRPTSVRTTYTWYGREQKKKKICVWQNSDSPIRFVMDPDSINIATANTCIIQSARSEKIARSIWPNKTFGFSLIIIYYRGSELPAIVIDYL